VWSCLPIELKSSARIKSLPIFCYALQCAPTERAKLMNTGIPPWKVLLIGGSSGTGKTVSATALAKRLGTENAQLDDFRLVLEQITTISQQPALHFLEDPQNAHTVEQLSPEDLCEKLIEVAQVMSRAIEIVIAHHVATDRPLILEGDGLLPHLAAQQHFVNLDVQPGMVRFVLLYEPDEATLLANLKGRKRGIDHRPEAVQRRQAHTAWLYGQWLRSEALRYHVPVIASASWQNLPDRILIATS
jgi:2-phosphoglycerate kinase